jgi:hypothetical protein
MNADGSDPNMERGSSQNYDYLFGGFTSWADDPFVSAYEIPVTVRLAYTYIHWILYQGNWYWDRAVVNNGPGETDWYPHVRKSDFVPPDAGLKPLPAISTSLVRLDLVGDDVGSAWEMGCRDGLDGVWYTCTTMHPFFPYTHHEGGLGGHTYYYRIRGIDAVGNVESWPEIPDAFTTIEAEPPVINWLTPGRSFQKGDLMLAWEMNEVGGSVLLGADIRYQKDDSDVWHTYITEMIASEMLFEADPGHTYTFQIQASDDAGNRSAWKSLPPITFYDWYLRANVYDAAGNPIPEYLPSVNPGGFIETPTNHNGQNAAIYAVGQTTYDVAWPHANTGQLPVSSYPSTNDVDIDIFLPPANDIIQNGDFEQFGSRAMPAWDHAGHFLPVQTESAAHTGEAGMQLGISYGLTLTAEIPYPGYVFFDDAANTIKAWVQGSNIYLQRNNAPPEIVLEDPEILGGHLHGTVDANGLIHLLWTDLIPTGNNRYRVFHLYQNQSGEWIGPINAVPLIEYLNLNIFPERFILSADEIGGVHIIILNSYDEPWHKYSFSNGAWGQPLVLGSSFAYKLDTTGNLHLIVGTGTNDYEYRYRMYPPNAQTWTIEEILPITTYIYTVHWVIEEDGTRHIVYRNRDNTEYIKSDAPGSWTPAIAMSNKNCSSLKQSADKNLFMLCTEYNEDYLLRLSPDGEVSEQHLVVDTPYPYPGFYLLEGDNGELVFLVDTGEYLAHDQLQVYDWDSENGWIQYRTFPALTHISEENISLDWRGELMVYHRHTFFMLWQVFHAPETLSSVISQTVSIPENMKNPVFSFMYQWIKTVPESYFSVQINDGVTNTHVFTNAQSLDGWQHSALALDAWMGKTIDISFETLHAKDDSETMLYLDEISLGSTYPDTWVSLVFDQLSARPGDVVGLSILAGNRNLAQSSASILSLTLSPELQLVDASGAYSHIGQALIWENLPMEGQSEIVLTATLQITNTVPLDTWLEISATLSFDTELTINNNFSLEKLYIGNRCYLPVIRR